MQPETKALIASSLRGIAEVYETDRGLTFSRLPAWTNLHHEHDGLTGKVARQGSGARILISTAATQLTFTYRATLDTADSTATHERSTVSVSTEGFEEAISHNNGNLRVWSNPVTPEFVEGEDSVATFELPEASDSRDVSIWLPHCCDIEIVDLTANAPMVAATPPGARWLHYGSSISHCIEADSPLGAWPARVANDRGFDLYSLGLAGSCNLEQFAARTIRDWPADLISLKLGINVVNGATMTERTFISAVHALLDTVREGQPNTRIVLISPIYCEGHEHLPGPVGFDVRGKAIGSQPREHEWAKELTLVRAREILEQVVAKRDDAHLEYLSGLELFSSADADLMPDGLHPNPEGYLLIAERFKNLVLR